MQVLEALISFLFFLFFFALLYFPPHQIDSMHYKAMLEEDANNVFYFKGGFEHPDLTLLEFKATGICVEFDSSIMYLKDVQEC